MIGGSNQANWLRIIEALEAPELAADARFNENRDRMINLEALQEELARHFKRRTTADWLARFEAVNVPAGPVYSIKEMHQDPQVQAREMVPEVEHAKLGRVKTLGTPVKFSATPAGIRRGAPLYGQHTREVLREAGWGDAEIDRLVAEGAVTVA